MEDGKGTKRTFFGDAEELLNANEAEPIRKLYDLVRSKNCEIRWGTVKHIGSFSVIGSELFSKSIIGLYSDLGPNTPKKSTQELLRQAYGGSQMSLCLR